MKTDSIVQSLVAKGAYKFNGTLFGCFQNRVTETLTAMGLEQFLDGANPPAPPPTSSRPTATDIAAIKTHEQELADFKKAKFTAVLLIKHLCDADHLAMIDELVDPKAIMEVFRQAYANAEPTNVRRLKEEFFKFKYNLENVEK